MKLKTLEGAIDLSVLSASVNKPRTDVLGLTLLCCVQFTPCKIRPMSLQRMIFLAWRSRDWEGVRGFLCLLAVMPSGQMSGEPTLTVTTYLSFLLAGMSHDLVSGPCFSYLPMYHDSLKISDHSSCPHWVPGATRYAEMPFVTPFFFLPSLAPKPAGLLNFTCFLQWQEVLLCFFMGTLIALATYQE